MSTPHPGQSFDPNSQQSSFSQPVGSGSPYAVGGQPGGFPGGATPGSGDKDFKLSRLMLFAWSGAIIIGAVYNLFGGIMLSNGQLLLGSNVGQMAPFFVSDVSNTGLLMEAGTKIGIVSLLGGIFGAAIVFVLGLFYAKRNKVIRIILIVMAALTAIGMFFSFYPNTIIGDILGGLAAGGFLWFTFRKSTAALFVGAAAGAQAGQFGQQQFGQPQYDQQQYGQPQGGQQQYGQQQVNQPQFGASAPAGAPQSDPYAAPQPAGNQYPQSDPYAAPQPAGNQYPQSDPYAAPQPAANQYPQFNAPDTQYPANGAAPQQQGGPVPYPTAAPASQAPTNQPPANPYATPGSTQYPNPYTQSATDYAQQLAEEGKQPGSGDKPNA